jgi:hypothetical protein
MTKGEAEKAVRQLATEWARKTGYIAQSGHYPSFSEFKRWLTANGYSHYLDFRSATSPDYVAEQWFESELKRWGKPTF